jgi:membrane dipeptidase
MREYKITKVIDMHCDTIYRLLCKKDSGENGSLRENEGHIDLLRMKQSSYLLQNFAMFVELDRDGDPWERVQRICGHYRSEMEKNSDLIAPVLQFSDIAANEAAGKMSSLLTVEEGAVCKGELSRLQTLYDMGVRMITLTWNFPNELGYPNNVADNIPGWRNWGSSRMCPTCRMRAFSTCFR